MKYVIEHAVSTATLSVGLDDKGDLRVAINDPSSFDGDEYVIVLSRSKMEELIKALGYVKSEMTSDVVENVPINTYPNQGVPNYPPGVRSSR